VAVVTCRQRRHRLGMAKGRAERSAVFEEKPTNSLTSCSMPSISLKWGTEVNQQLIAEIRQKVPPAPGSKLKDKERVSDMPVTSRSAATDKIGTLQPREEGSRRLLFRQLPIATSTG